MGHYARERGADFVHFYRFELGYNHAPTPGFGCQIFTLRQPRAGLRPVIGSRFSNLFRTAI
jgi:hypothetical protein